MTKDDASPAGFKKSLRRQFGKSYDDNKIGNNYLKDVLTRLPAMTTKDDLRPLLPGRWQAVLPAPATPAPTR